MRFRSTLHGVLEISRFQSRTADGQIYRLHSRGSDCMLDLREHSRLLAWVIPSCDWYLAWPTSTNIPTAPS